MTDVHRELIFRAIIRHGDDITPCRGGSWSRSFLVTDGRLVLAYNLPSGTSRSVNQPIEAEYTPALCDAVSGTA